MQKNIVCYVNTIQAHIEYPFHSIFIYSQSLTEVGGTIKLDCERSDDAEVSELSVFLRSKSTGSG